MHPGDIVKIPMVSAVGYTGIILFGPLIGLVGAAVIFLVAFGNKDSGSRKQ
jgi:hypothetical protein